MMDTGPKQPVDPVTRGRVRAELAWAVGLWCVAAFVGAAWVILPDVKFFGEQVSPGERHAAVQRLIVCLVGAVVGGALVVAHAVRRRAYRWASLLVLVWLVGTGLAGRGLDHLLPDPPDPRPYPACQEHSGGETRCPGG